MNWFKNKKTITQLLLGFGFLSALTAVVGYMGVTGMSKINALLDDTYNKEMAGVVSIQTVDISMLEISRTVRQSVLDAGNAEGLRKDEQEYSQNSSDLNARLAELDRYFYTEQGRLLVSEIRKNSSEYTAATREVLNLAVNNNDKAAIEQVAKARESADRTMDAIARTTVFKKNRAGEFFNESQATFASTRNEVVGIVFVAILFGLAIGYFIAQMIARPMAEVGEVLGRLAERDLTARTSGNAKGDFKRLEDAVNAVAANLEQALEEVRGSSDQIALTAESLASASQEISSGAQEQASGLEETSATLEQISATVKQNADNARQANQLAFSARESAEKGGLVMTSAVAAMGEINTASSRIADIITTIDEIAFQTNLLALNAAVEAARAGEQGRGFAVVASEVRSLAQRSASSAKEIKALIQDSARKVEKGSELVNDSGKTLSDIVAGVKRVTDIVGEIAAASQEQATGVEQVAKATSQMDQVTQQNAAQTEELSSSAEELSGTAAGLQELVKKFVLTNSNSRPAAAKVVHQRVTAPRRSVAPKTSKGSGLVALAHKTGHSDGGFEEF